MKLTRLGLFDVNVPAEFLLRIFTEKLISDSNTNVLSNDPTRPNNINSQSDRIKKPEVYPQPEPKVKDDFNPTDIFTSTLVIKPVRPVKPVAPVAPPRPPVSVPITVNKPVVKPTPKPSSSGDFFKQPTNLDDAFKDWMSLMDDGSSSSRLYDSAKRHIKGVKESFDSIGTNAKKQFVEGLGSKLSSDANLFSLDTLKQEGSRILQEKFYTPSSGLGEEVKKVVVDRKKSNQRPQETCLIM